MTALDPDALEDWVLANAPEFVRGMRQADEDLAKGRTISLDAYLAERRQRRTSARGKGSGGARRSTGRR